MDNSDVLQRNADGELEVRVVNGTEKADAPANYDDVFTVNTEGKRALRVVGAGGGGGTGTVTSVNGVQPVDGNVEITGDNITATVGAEEATITQHLTTLKNDEAELGEQVQTNQSDINTLKNQQYPYPEDSEFTVVTLPQTAQHDWYRLKLSASVDENATTAIPDGIYGYYAYVKNSYLNSEDNWLEYGKIYAFIKFSVKGGKFSTGEFGGQDLLFVPYIPKQFFTTTATESQVLSNGTGALANISFDQTAASIIDNKIILAPDSNAINGFGVNYVGGTDERLEAGFTPIRNLETGAELVTSGELVADIDWETQQILYGTPSPYKTEVERLPSLSWNSKNYIGSWQYLCLYSGHQPIEVLFRFESADGLYSVYKVEEGRVTRLDYSGGANAKFYYREEAGFPYVYIDNTDGNIVNTEYSYYGAYINGTNDVSLYKVDSLPSDAVSMPFYSEPARIPQYNIMPDVDIWTFGQIAQYVGQTTEKYTHGYLYEATGEYVEAGASIDFGDVQDATTHEIEQGVTVTITSDALKVVISEAEKVGLSPGNLNGYWFWQLSTGYTYIGYNPEAGSALLAFVFRDEDLVFSEKPTKDVMWPASNCHVFDASIQNGVWQQIDVQPTGSVSITTDTSLQGAGTTESPLGISAATMATINGKQDALTAEQLAAVNSGITSAKVANYDAYADEISTAQSTADKADGAAEVAQQTANLAGQNAAQALSGLNGKVNIAQGADNAGKILGIGADGNVTPVEAPNSGAATLLYYDSTQAPDHSHAMSGVSLDGYGLAGYEVYSNGYVRQWGQDSTSTGTTLVTLPISYTAATTVSMSFFVSVTEVAAAPTGQISAIPVAANQFQVDKPSAVCNWETSGYITLS